MRTRPRAIVSSDRGVYDCSIEDWTPGTHAVGLARTFTGAAKVLSKRYPDRPRVTHNDIDYCRAPLGYFRRRPTCN